MAFPSAGFVSDALQDDLGNAIEGESFHVYAHGTTTAWPLYTGPGTAKTPLAGLPLTDGPETVVIASQSDA